AANWYRSETSSYLNSHFDGQIKNIMVFDQQLNPIQIQELAEVVTGPEEIDIADIDLIDTSLLHKLGFQSVDDDEMLDLSELMAEEKETEVAFVDEMPVLVDASLEIEADHGV
ncbi:MAG: hypothetical protein AB8B94_14990, partial [Hyphomicrobiales bacterium]